AVGNPAVTIAESAGWSLHEERADAYAGQNVELRFHLDSDASVQLAGLAIDDVSVTACRLPEADLAITKTDGQVSTTAGSPIQYTIMASNPGPSDAPGTTVADT